MADLVGNVYVTASLISVSSSNPGSLQSGHNVAHVWFSATSRVLAKTRQNGRNVNPFGAMASVAGDRSGP